MFILIENEPEEFGDYINCDLVGVYHTFAEAHDAMARRLEESEKREHWCDLEAEDLDDEGVLYDANGNNLISWRIFEVKE